MFPTILVGFKSKTPLSSKPGDCGVQTGLVTVVERSQVPPLAVLFTVIVTSVPTGTPLTVTLPSAVADGSSPPTVPADELTTNVELPASEYGKVTDYV